MEKKTVKSLIEYLSNREGVGYVQLKDRSEEHVHFFMELLKLSSQKTLHLNPLPADIDEAANLTDAEWDEWMEKFKALPK